MAEDKVEAREVSWRQLLPWTELFRGFQVALDLNKLLLAAAGIFVMSAGWWLLSIVFTVNEDKAPRTFGQVSGETWAQFRQARDHWNLMHEAATLAPSEDQVWEVEDLAQSEAEYELFKDVKNGKAYQDKLDSLIADKNSVLAKNPALRREYTLKIPQYAKLGTVKPHGRLSTWPWFEDRGPNPYLLVTGQAGIPWEAGRFWDWFVRDQLLVMIEPLVKFVQPIVYFFSPRAEGFWTKLYFFCVMLWTLATWSLFGGAITRIAAVQVSRGEKIGLTEALRFTARRLVSYVAAPLSPLVFILFLLVCMIVFSLIHMIPFVGDFFSGILWPVMLIFGLVIAVALVGLVGWPLMAATISTEGTDFWEAVSRSYSYVFQKPWHYLWYSLVAIAYGAVLVFFVGLMGSLMVYLAKWGVAQAPRVLTPSREPSYLFVYAPTSFQWRELLLQGVQVEGQDVVQNGRINSPAYQAYLDAAAPHWWNRVAAVMVAFWLFLVFLLIVGFGYSYFWGAGTIIYLLMRRNVDAAELDEVYLEEDEQEGAYGGPLTTPAAPSEAVKTPPSLTMVEPPTLRTPPTPEPVASPRTSPPSVTGGNAPPEPPPPEPLPSGGPPPVVAPPPLREPTSSGLASPPKTPGEPTPPAPEAGS